MKRALTLAGALTLIASVALAQVPISLLPPATTPLTGAEAVPMVQSGVTKKATVNSWVSTATGTTTARALADRFADVVNLKDYGALGNSNGTTGNGHDDTAAFQAALNAAATAPPTAGETGGVLYVPCGTFRLTSGVTGTAIYPSTYSVVGQGACSQIYLDTATAVTAFTFSPASCQSAPPCLVIKGLNFIPPTNSGSSVLSTTNEAGAIFSGNIINGWRNGWTLTASYAPEFRDNRVLNLGGAALDCTTDASCNNAIIWNNKVFNSGASRGDAVFLIGGGANNVSFYGNDVEANYGAVALKGVTSFDAEGNYIERNTNFGIYAASGSNSQHKWGYNWFFSNGPANVMDAGNVNGLVIDGNTWNTQTLTLGTATNIAYGLQTVQTTVTLPGYCAAGTACAYIKPGVLEQWGKVTTSSATPGLATVTLPTACPTAAYTVTASTGDGTPSVAVAIGAETTTNFPVSTTSGPATVYWRATCQ